eukprot:TRINITY_DN857_c0_g1_i1.p1 TRINITY_DN857_c0_g1~~TRINITY_DN857_c0_g1_i1.p1  ORF type:complete len:161 (+),score=84.03 TRINITY_DN857_c0_g1_i1:65-547(+)
MIRLVPNLVKFITTQWTNATSSQGELAEIAFVEQFNPARQTIENFERYRSAMEAKIAPNKLQTIIGYIVVPNEAIQTLINVGFSNLNSLFYRDPELLLIDHPEANRVFQVRIALGRPVEDYTELDGKIKLRDLRAAIVSFVLIVARPNQAVQYIPTNEIQ